jgi:hypothetical protein
LRDISFSAKVQRQSPSEEDTRDENKNQVQNGSTQIIVIRRKNKFSVKQAFFFFLRIAKRRIWGTDQYSSRKPEGPSMTDARRRPVEADDASSRSYLNK